MALESFRGEDSSFRISFARERGIVPARAEKTSSPTLPDLSTYLHDAITPSNPENVAPLDLLTQNILIATWGGMRDEEIAHELGSETDPAAVAATRENGYLTLGITSVGLESDLEAVQKAIETGSVDLSLLLNQETLRDRINKYPSLPQQEIHEALRFMHGENVLTEPRTSPHKQETSQRKQLLLSAFTDLGETRGEMAFTYTVAERALQERLKTIPPVDYATLPPAA